MNNQIDELVEQVITECAPDWPEFRFALTENGGLYLHVFAEKLTELVVKECAKVCLEQRDPANLNYKPSAKFAQAIKEHFGVVK